MTSLSEHLAATRKIEIEFFLKLLYDDVDRYAMILPKTICSEEANVAEARNCDATAYGARLLALQKLHMWPKQSVADIRVSVCELGNKLKTYPSVYASYLLPREAQAHQSCHEPAYPEHDWNILKVYKMHRNNCHERRVSMLEMHETHMKAQNSALRGYL